MKHFDRRAVLTGAKTFAILGAMAWLPKPSAAAISRMTVYRTPTCGCCGAWIDHIQQAGCSVDEVETDDLSPLKAEYGIPPELQACHTGVIDGYVVEGHVPVADVIRLVTERPDALGISVPGMPVGSPGMEMGNRVDPFAVILFSAAGAEVFSEYR